MVLSGKYRNQNEFTNFRMEIASDYVKTNLELDMNDQKFVECVESLCLMLMGKTQTKIISVSCI